MSEDAPRIAPLSHAEFVVSLAPPDAKPDPAEVAEPAPGSGPPAILYTIARHPSLLRPMLEFSNALAMQGCLARRDSEILALRAAWNCRSEFEWGHHVAYAMAHGLNEAEVERLAFDPKSALWSARDRALLSAADELHRDQCVGGETWSVLADHYDEAQLVEICFVVGQYTMLSMVARSTDVQLEPGYPGLPGLPKSGSR
jgi:4-carboxymuconolactone decarboxylase